jgi:hypothetical protein
LNDRETAERASHTPGHGSLLRGFAREKRAKKDFVAANVDFSDPRSTRLQVKRRPQEDRQ